LAGFFNAWLLIGWREIDPTNLSWLAGDPAEHQVGWEFMRHAAIWQFPPTWISHLHYPWGVSASYLDVIPLLALPLRTLSPFLPVNFQYLGLYGGISCCLQIWYGLKLTSLFAEGDRLVALFGAVFFLLSPVLTAQFYGHFALVSHWVILANLYYYFRTDKTNASTRAYRPFLIVAAVAAAIQPYIAIMAAAVGVAAAFRANGSTAHSQPPSESRLQRYGKTATCIGLLILVTASSFVLFGFWVPGKSWFAGEGYTLWAMNILAPINPHEHALYLKPFPLAGENTLAGYDYLGLGTLLLLFVALARNPALLRMIWSPSVRPVTVASIVCTLLALSLRVTFADHVLFTVPAPKPIVGLLAAFRASGRLFWPAYYLLTLGAIVATIVSIPSRWARRLLLTAALLIQYLDVLAVRDGVAAQARTVHISSLASSEWGRLPVKHGHLVIIPAMQCDAKATPSRDAWLYMAQVAARGGMTLNSVYLPRISPQNLRYDCSTLPQQLSARGLQTDTAYVLDDRTVLAVLKSPTHSHFCRKVDGLNLCTFDPARSFRSALLVQQIRSAGSIPDK